MAILISECACSCLDDAYTSVTTLSAVSNDPVDPCACSPSPSIAAAGDCDDADEAALVLCSTHSRYVFPDAPRSTNASCPPTVRSTSTAPFGISSLGRSLRYSTKPKPTTGSLHERVQMP